MAFFCSAGFQKAQYHPCVRIVDAKAGFMQPWNRRSTMKKENELAIKVTKEIVVKFIEAGRLSVSSFQEVWHDIHQTVSHSMKETKIED